MIHWEDSIKHLWTLISRLYHPFRRPRSDLNLIFCLRLIPCLCSSCFAISSDRSYSLSSYRPLFPFFSGISSSADVHFMILLCHHHSSSSLTSTLDTPTNAHDQAPHLCSPETNCTLCHAYLFITSIHHLLATEHHLHNFPSLPYLRPRPWPLVSCLYCVALRCGHDIMMMYLRTFSPGREMHDEVMGCCVGHFCTYLYCDTRSGVSFSPPLAVVWVRLVRCLDISYRRDRIAVQVILAISLWVKVRPCTVSAIVS